MKKILFISNGHGEDAIANKIISCLRAEPIPDIDIHAWPMVGEGAAYTKNEIPVMGPFNRLPSCGFATLSWRWMVKDLLAGWIPTHLRQIKAAAALKKSYSLIIAVGDIVVIGAACLSGSPFFLVGCAKSSYYSHMAGYTRLEKYLLRKHCLKTFPRDALTAEELDKWHVPNAYVGNPMMDDLEGTGLKFGIPESATVIGVLPGSRFDAEVNARHFLRVAENLNPDRMSSPLFFLFAAYDDFNIEHTALKFAPEQGMLEWKTEKPRKEDADNGIALRLTYGHGTKAWFIKHRFADVLRKSALIVGTAGMANEQAVGLGKPLIVFPTEGAMGPAYVKMKMKFFGPSALRVPSDPISVAKAIEGLLADTAKQHRMSVAGQERMGTPGASQVISNEIILFLNNLSR